MKIYIDMDGVIADFHGWMKSHVPDITEDMWRNTNIPWDVMNDNYRECYLDLEPLHLLGHANYLYNSLPNVKFLTAIPTDWWMDYKGDIAMLNKTMWLERYINNFEDEDVLFTPGAGGKIKYAEQGAVLYDDREDTIRSWNEAGGIGIHVKGM